MNFKTFFIAFVVFMAAMTFNAPACAADSTTDTAASQNFVKKRYTIKGGWDIVTENGKTVIQFDDNFKTKGGPDLKVFLHTNSVDAVTSETTAATGMNIGVLKSNKGAQSYIVPDDINVSDYKSVLIHCEAYSVLWGGFDIPHDNLAKAASTP